MGRNKKPTNLKLLAGNPGHRPLNFAEPKPKAIIPEPFVELDKYARTAWDKLAPMLYKIRVLTEADAMALTLLCQTWGDYCIARRIEGSLKNDVQKFIVQTGVNGAVYQNPLRGCLNTLIKQLDQLMSRFGLSPVSRANILTDLRTEREQENDFEEFLS